MKLQKFIIGRFTENRSLSVAILLSSFLVSILALTSPLFIMLVLNRYVVYGVSGTLWTLALGALVAIFFEWGLRRNRLIMADEIIDDRGFLANRVIGILTKTRSDILSRIPESKRNELLQGLEAIETVLSSVNLVAVLDVPFAVLSLFVLYLISPTFAFVALIMLLIAIGVGVLNYYQIRKPTKANEETRAASQAIATSAIFSADTVRAFNASQYIADKWKEMRESSLLARRLIQQLRGTETNSTMALSNLMGLALTVTGAIGVVNGEISVGAMIGAGILGRRAMQPISMLTRIAEPWQRAKQGLESVSELNNLPTETNNSMSVSPYSGHVELEDASIQWPGSSSPLVESLNLKMKPGEVLIVTGNNGSGKTTFARTLAGLIPLSRGKILIDGTELQQLAPSWWKSQLVYFPQQPDLLNDTIRNNIVLGNDAISDEELSKIVQVTGLDEFIRSSKDGFDSEVHSNGHNLSLGIQRRISLARALLVNGRVAILDEPIEALDNDGKARVFDVIQQMANMGKTIILLSSDQNLIGNAHYILNLNQKPKPSLVKQTKEPSHEDA